MRTKALFNSSLYLAVSTSSLARPVRSLQSNAIFNQPSACHFAAEEMEQIKMKRRKTSWGRTNWRQRKGPQELKKCLSLLILLSVERVMRSRFGGCGGVGEVLKDLLCWCWRVDIRYILGGVGEVIDWRLNSFTVGNWSPSSPTSSTQCLSQSAATN